MAEALAPLSNSIRRRHVLAAGVAGFGMLFADRGEACTLVADPNTPFSNRECRRGLRWFVDMLNEGPSMSVEAIAEQVDERSAWVDDEMLQDVLGERANEVDRQYMFFREYRISGGRLDPRPIRLEDVNLIRRLRNRATYQFTLERYRYHPADPEGCNGLFVHDEYYGINRYSYLSTFWNNRLQSISSFPEWYLEEVA